MARVSVAVPDAFTFTTTLAVRVGDVNYGGHLGNDAVLGLVHEARVRFLASHGFTEGDVGGIGLIMSDAAVVYKSEGAYGQEIRIDVAVSDVARSSFDLVYLLADASDGKEVARVKTGMVCFDYERRRPGRVPEAFLEAIDGQR